MASKETKESKESKKSMESRPLQKSRIISNFFVFTTKVGAWSLISSAAFLLLFAAIVALAIHTPGGRRLLLCPVYDTVVSSLGSTPESKNILKTVSKEWRNTPHPSADWAYLPISDVVIPVPVQNWTKHSTEKNSGVLLHLQSEIMSIKLEKPRTPLPRSKVRKLQEELLTASLGPESSTSNLLRESFRHDLTQKCAAGASWKVMVTRILMAYEKTALSQPLAAAWRNVTPASLTLVRSAPTGSIGDRWTVQVLFNLPAKKAKEKTLSLTYANLSEPLMQSVMQQIGLIRDTSLADRDLPANFFRSPDEQGNPPVAQGDRSTTRL